jgi:hypothetical protein
MKRHVFYISDRTGITAEVLGGALLSQFEDHMDFEEKTIPFVDNQEKAEAVREKIDRIARETGHRPIVFDTIVDPSIRAIVRQSSGLIMDFFHTFIGPLEKELGVTSSFRVGKHHAIDDKGQYDHRIEAVNFALNADDGKSPRYFDEAEVILVGVSRCGKTPTSLYLAMQFGIYAANYPFTPDDLEKPGLPKPLQSNKDKLFGLTIDPVRLHEIRTQRRSGSQYASLQQCQREVRMVEALYRRYGIQFLDATSKSIEEIATLVVESCNLERRLF